MNNLKEKLCSETIETKLTSSDQGVQSYKKEDMNEMEEGNALDLSLHSYEMDSNDEVLWLKTIEIYERKPEDLRLRPYASWIQLSSSENLRKYLLRITDSNPSSEIIWFEDYEMYGKELENAQKMILQACELKPNDKGLWLKAVETHKTKPETAKKLIMQACELNPKSGILQFQAVNMHNNEPDVQQKLILRACELNPNNGVIWLKFIDLLETETEYAIKFIEHEAQMNPKSKKLLLSAVDLRTKNQHAFKQIAESTFNIYSVSEKLWHIALILDKDQRLNVWRRAFEHKVARFWSYNNRKKSLVDLIDNFPCEKLFRLEFAILEEEYGKGQILEETFDRALITCADYGVEIDRREWINEAIKADSHEFFKSCKAIMNSVIGVQKESEDYMKEWINEVEYCSNKEAYQCAYAVCDRLLQVFPTNMNFALRVLFGNKSLGNGTNSTHDKKAFYFLVQAKKCWIAKNYINAGGCFMKAFKENSKYEQILGETFNQFKSEARRSSIGIIERIENAWAMNDLDFALDLLQDKLDSKDYNLWMMKGRIELQKKYFTKARKSLVTAIELNPYEAETWLLLSELEEIDEKLPEAREVLKSGKMRNPENDRLHIASIRLENRAGNERTANLILIEALEKCQWSGQLWAETIFIEPRTTRDKKAVEALEKHDKFQSEYVMLEVANMFFSKGEIVKSRKWFNKTVENSPFFGDAWAYFFKFEMLFGTKEFALEVKQQCVAAKPSYGNIWKTFRNKIENRGLTSEDLLDEILKTLQIPGIKDARENKSSESTEEATSQDH